MEANTEIKALIRSRSNGHVVKHMDNIVEFEGLAAPSAANMAEGDTIKLKRIVGGKEYILSIRMVSAAEFGRYGGWFATRLMSPVNEQGFEGFYHFNSGYKHPTYITEKLCVSYEDAEIIASMLNEFFGVKV